MGRKPNVVAAIKAIVLANLLDKTQPIIIGEGTKAMTIASGGPRGNGYSPLQMYHYCNNSSSG